MVPSMRTTVTLDADTESLLREAMRQRGRKLSALEAEMDTDAFLDVTRRLIPG